MIVKWQLKHKILVNLKYGNSLNNSKNLSSLFLYKIREKYVLDYVLIS